MSAESKIRIILARIERAARTVQRDPASIKLLCVSKTKSIDEILEVASALHTLNLPLLFGENYVQEIQEKIQKFPPHTELHFIGRLQSNKIRYLLENDICIQSIATQKHLEVLEKEAKKLNKTARIFLQVNVSEDPRKAGFSVIEAEEIFKKSYSHANIEGLMTIPELIANKNDLRNAFAKLRSLRGNRSLLLSMGMSDDLEVAIEEGSDLIRIGTAIFGARNTSP